MWSRTHTLVLALALIAMGCSDTNPTQSVVPAPPTTDDLIIADCYEIQAALEAFAAGNGGEYPSHWQDVDAFVASVKRPNRYTGLETEPRLIEAEWPGEIGVVLYYELDLPPRALGYRIMGRGAQATVITIENTAFVSPAALDVYAILLAQVDVVEAAVEQFAAEARHYPATVAADETPLGRVLIDFLPGGMLLLNPLGVYSNPIDGNAQGMEGQLGYVPEDLTGSAGWIAYTIDASGPLTGETVVLRRTFSDEDRHTRTLMARCQDAVEAFRSTSGRYPNNVELDETPAGDTVLELMSFPLINVYTSAVMKPRNGLATAPGEIGYQPVIENDVVVGYAINGFGILEEFFRIEVLP